MQPPLPPLPTKEVKEEPEEDIIEAMRLRVSARLTKEDTWHSFTQDTIIGWLNDTDLTMEQVHMILAVIENDRERMISLPE